MNVISNKKPLGFYVLLLTAVAAILSFVNGLLWVLEKKGYVDTVVLAGLVLGLLVNLFLLVKNNDFLVVIATICYSIALFRLLVNSVGSFVDAFQGITMFGDSTQINRIISVSAMIFAAVLLSIVSGFLKREEE